jgi:hypothetical protein
LRRRDVTDHLTVDVGAVSFDVGLDDAGFGDDEMASDLDGSLDASLDDEILIADEGAADGHVGADETRR